MQETNYAGALAAIADPSTPLIIDLWAEWCGYCIKTRPHLERIAAERIGTLRVIAIDTDEDPEAFDGLGVKTLPTIILYKDGQEIARRGSGDYEEIQAWLAEHGI